MAGALSRLTARAGSLRWRALYESAKWLYGHGRRAWGNLEPTERRRIGELVRKSKGRHANLTQRERDELWALVKRAGTGRD